MAVSNRAEVYSLVGNHPDEVKSDLKRATKLYKDLIGTPLEAKHKVGQKERLVRLAELLFEAGDTEGAIDCQSKSILLADGAEKEELKKVLRGFFSRIPELPIINASNSE